MTLGDRITHRLGEIKRDTKWLIKTTKMRPSTVYEIVNGRQKSTTKLPTIAHHLGLYPLWLEREIGPRLIGEAPDKMPRVVWPFSVEENRILSLNPAELHLVEAAMVGVLQAIEARRSNDGGSSGIV